MKVPSYDDLTPSIPDVHPRETFDQVTRLVTGPEQPVVAPSPAAPPAATRALFACLRGKAGAPAALFALARDFSPRIEQHPDGSVVFDVVGLGRLLGDAQGIAAELHRSARDRGVKARIAVAPTHTAARLLTLGPADVAVAEDAAAAVAQLPLATLQAPPYEKLLDVHSRVIDASNRALAHRAGNRA